MYEFIHLGLIKDKGIIKSKEENVTNIVGIIISFPSFFLLGVEGSFEDFIDFDVPNVLMFLNILWISWPNYINTLVSCFLKKPTLSSL
jgi:hypothetical protein